jgi:hypothetical protein
LGKRTRLGGAVGAAMLLASSALACGSGNHALFSSTTGTGTGGSAGSSASAGGNGGHGAAGGAAGSGGHAGAGQGGAAGHGGGHGGSGVGGSGGASDAGPDGSDAGPDGAPDGGVVRHSQDQVVSSGNNVSSPKFHMTFTFGQPSPQQGTATSPKYRHQGGLVGATGSLP